MNTIFYESLKNHNMLFSTIGTYETNITNITKIILRHIKNSHKILIAGTGGSAADAQHFAAELVGRFQKNRRALPCIALTTDTSNITAIGNDFGFEQIFSRQVEALGNPGDVFIGISTSGNSANIIAAVEEARKRQVYTIGLLGRDGGVLKDKVDHAVVIPHDVTARIQEAHIFILHYWADMIERSI